MKIFNSLNKKKEAFIPFSENEVTMYVCGPTVYNFPHLGNARSVVIYDLFFRLFQKNFKKVIYVRNITDIDDKIIKAAKEENISIKDLSNKFLDIFHKDMASLNVINPTHEPKATDNISEIIEMITKLLKNNFAYESENHILFDVKSYKDYGKLSNRSLDEMIAGYRVEKAQYKRNPLDFVLWKPASTNDDKSAIFNSPWGEGRPGWHIECSAMSHKFLGNNFDIHGGGADLQFPHHENEIAQSICSNPTSQHAKYWVHNGFLTVGGEKMSKSLGNFITVRDLLDKNIDGIVIRYFLLSAHYRKPLDFSPKSIEDAKKSINKFYESIFDSKIIDDDYQNSNNSYLNEIKQSLEDDLNTPKAFAILHKASKEIKKEKNKDIKSKLTNNLIESLSFLGLFDKNYLNSQICNTRFDKTHIEKQILIRKEARKSKKWALCDKIRDELLINHNVIIKDNSDGSVFWEVKN